MAKATIAVLAFMAVAACARAPVPGSRDNDWQGVDNQFLHASVWEDRVTGCRYVLLRDYNTHAGGVSVLVDRDGKPTCGIAK